MRMIRRASAVVNKKQRSSSLHVCGYVRMNQENGNVKFLENENLGSRVDSCGKKKVTLGCAETFEEGRLMGFTEEEKIQEDGKGHIGQERKFQDDEDVGCSLKKQERYNGNGFEEEAKSMGFHGRVKIQENENVGSDTNQEKVSAKNCCLNGFENIAGNEKGMWGFDTNQEKNGKTIQVWVARGKVQDKYKTTFKDEKVSTNEMMEVQFKSGSGKKVVGTTTCYSRKQMEDLRFVNMDDQNKKWGAIYCELGPAVKKEYDGLLDCNRRQSQLDIKKKVPAHGILGPVAVNRSWNHWYLCTEI